MNKLGNSSRDSQGLSRSNTLVLCDTSTSMGAFSGTKTRIQVLREVLLEITAAPYSGAVWEFNSICRAVAGPAFHVGEPSGGTDLTNALRVVRQFKPRPLIVISDGFPNDAESALDAARALHTQIITRFVGDDGNFAAIAFMRALAWCSSDGLGDAQVHRWDRPEALASDLRALLLRWEGGS